MWKIVWAAGTRPELIKMAPIVKELELDSEVDLTFVWSGQHYDYEMSRIFVEELKLPQPNHRLGIGSQTDCDQIASTVAQVGSLLARIKPDVVLAQGDTNTTAGVAIATSKRKIPFAHVEAGLRSFDRQMPEEINRMIVDICAELHFAPTPIASMNLQKEGIPPHKIHVTGNTIVDVVARNVKRLDISKTGSKHILATIHRQESVDNSKTLTSIVALLADLSEVGEVIIPLHPRTRNRLIEFDLYKRITSFPNIRIIKPQGYREFLGLLATSSLVLTDSGGVQEEAYILDIPTLTLRDNTERPETVIYGKNIIIGTNPVNVKEKAKKTLQIREKRIPLIPNALGDGNAGKTICKILLESLSEDLRIPHTIDLNPENRYGNAQSNGKVME